jgi:hypothetical protein
MMKRKIEDRIQNKIQISKIKYQISNLFTNINYFFKVFPEKNSGQAMRTLRLVQISKIKN